MAGKPPGWIVLGILRVLEEEGPMSRAQMAVALNAHRNEVGSVMSRMNKKLRTVPKRIYIKEWVHEIDCSDVYFPRAIYALGDKKDAVKPKRMTKAQVVARYRERHKGRVSSIFELAMTRNARIQRRKAIKEQFNVTTD